MEVVVRNALVADVWRLMPGWIVYRNWYLGEGRFVEKSPDIRRWVVAYVNETDATVAMGNLFSATERLLKAACKVEGVNEEDFEQLTLPHLLKLCVSADHRFFNLVGMCCDTRSIFRINAMRVGTEHGNHKRDKRELAMGNWSPADPDGEYLKIATLRLTVTHQAVCGIFNQVNPDTGRFAKAWQSRETADCEMFKKGLHDKDGRLPDEPTE